MKQLFVFSFLLICFNSFAQGITAPSTLTIEANATNVDAGDFVVSWGNNTDQILVSVSLDYINSATISFLTTTGLTRNYGYSSWTNVSSIVFYGTRDNINAGLAAMTISMGSIKTAIRINLEISQYNSSYVYNPVNKHYYKYVTSQAVSYASAKSGASGNSFLGKTGYLVTITSQAEQDFVNNNITGNNIWIAATDAGNEGTWKIDAGPESGTIFWQSTTAYSNTMTSNYSGGSTISGQYSNWSSGEPNNADGGNNGEDNAVAKWNLGTSWNDLAAANNSAVQGYIVEISADFPSGSDYTGVYSAYIVHNNEIAYSLKTGSGLNTSNISNYPNSFGGLQMNDGHTLTITSSSTLNTNKIYFIGTGKIVFTNATSKWMPGTSSTTNTLTHSPSTNNNPTYWSASSVWAGDAFGAYDGTYAHFTPWINSIQGWSAGAASQGHSLTLSYPVPAYITGIVTQGRQNMGQWVTQANVEVSLDNNSWTTVLTNANLNTDQTTQVNVLFPTVQYAKFVRVTPINWYGHPTMRLGLLIKQ